MSLLISVDYLSAQERLDALFTLTGDLFHVMDPVGMEMENRIRGRFETKTDPLGLPWAEWKPSTVESYPAGAHGMLLDRFGDMYESTTHIADSRSTTIGFGQEYAVYHEFGSKLMDRRGLLFDDPEAGTIAPGDEAAIVDIVELVFLQAAA